MSGYAKHIWVELGGIPILWRTAGGRVKRDIGDSTPEHVVCSILIDHSSTSTWICSVCSSDTFITPNPVEESSFIKALCRWADDLVGRGCSGGQLITLSSTNGIVPVTPGSGWTALHIRSQELVDRSRQCAFVVCPTRALGHPGRPISNVNVTSTLGVPWTVHPMSECVKWKYSCHSGFGANWVINIQELKLVKTCRPLAVTSARILPRGSPVSHHSTT